MIEQSLLNYIKQELHLGVKPEDITLALLNNKWNDNQIKEALYAAQHPENPAQFTEPNLIKNDPKRKLLITTVFVLGIALAIFGTWQLWYCIFSPQAMADKIINTLANAKSLSADTQINLNFAIPNKDIIASLNEYGRDLNGTTTIAFDIFGSAKIDRSTEKTATELNLNIKLADTNPPITSLKIEQPVSLQTKLINNDFFVNTSYLPNFGPINFNNLTNRWIMFNGQEMNKMEATNTAEQVRQYQEKTTLIQKMLPETNLFDQAKFVGFNNGQLKYSFTINKNSLLNFIIKADNILNATTTTNEKIATIKTILDKITFHNNYLWLSWYDLKLKQITLGIINDNLVNSSADLSIQLTSLNLPINLKKPEAYQSFQFLMAEQAKQFQSDIEKAINTTGTDTLPKTK